MKIREDFIQLSTVIAFYDAQRECRTSAMGGG